MIGLIQRVAEAAVDISGDRVAEIGPGMLVLIGVTADDTREKADRLAHRLLNYRLFQDTAGRMNLSLLDTGCDILLVPQFTLAADTKKGMRAGFSRGAPPDKARELFSYLVSQIEKQSPAGFGSGRFGADMQVSLINDGPVTFWIEI